MSQLFEIDGPVCIAITATSTEHYETNLIGNFCAKLNKKRTIDTPTPMVEPTANHDNNLLRYIASGFIVSNIFDENGKMHSHK